jgi:hypothetical protein
MLDGAARHELFVLLQGQLHGNSGASAMTTLHHEMARIPMAGKSGD